MSRQAVDGFALLPPIACGRSKRVAWTKFIDWNLDGTVSVSEVAVAIAALLPIDADHAEEFVSSAFDADGNGVLDVEEIRDRVLPFLRKRMAKLIASAAKPPQIFNTSSRTEFIRWFEHWVEKDRREQLSTSCLQVALASSLESESSPSMRRTLTAVILAEAGIEGREFVSMSTFLESLVPVLKLNLPEKEPSTPGSIIFDPKAPSSISLMSTTGRRKKAAVPASATVGTLRAEVRRQYRLWLGSMDAELWIMGERLCDDSKQISALPYAFDEQVVQVSRKIKVVAPSISSRSSNGQNEGYESDTEVEDLWDTLSCDSSSSEEDSLQ